MSIQAPRAGIPKIPSDVRVCIPGVKVRMKNADQWLPIMNGDPGEGNVVSWQAGNGSNGVRVKFEMGTLLCSPDEIELVDCDDTRSALVEGVLSTSRLEDVLQKPAP